MKFDFVIVGAGFTGSVLAERLANVGMRVLVVERRDHIGGNAYDYFDGNGILCQKYGVHIFHTNSRRIWEHLSRFTAWRPYYHRALAVVDGKQVPVPFNLNSIYATFSNRLAGKLEDALVSEFAYGTTVPILRLREAQSQDLRWLADFVYRNVFMNYTRKQWDLMPEELDASVTARVPVSVSRDDRYFQDTYQAMPQHGYTELFRRMLRHPSIKLMLNTDYREIVGGVQYDRLVFTGPIDEYFDYSHGPLPYRSMRFEYETLDQEWYQPVAQVNYPNEHDYTRIIEQKHATGQRHPKSTLIFEYPQPHVRGQTEPYYPVPRADNRELYSRYLADARQLEESVIFAGRLADYRYYNMDQAVARALKVFDEIVSGGCTGRQESPIGSLPTTEVALAK